MEPSEWRSKRERQRLRGMQRGRVEQKRIIYSSINYGIHRIGINYRKCQCVCAHGDGKR